MVFSVLFAAAVVFYICKRKRTKVSIPKVNKAVTTETVENGNQADLEISC
jgi:hypothetical protein